jgi:outer membrane protein TolC
MEFRRIQMLTRYLGWITIVSLALAGAFACAPEKRYEYESIVSDYGYKPHEEKSGSREPPTPEAPRASQITGRIGIENAVTIAIRNNPDIEKAFFRITQSEALIDEANAAFWPALNFFTEYLKGDAPSAYLFKKIDQRELEPSTDFNDPGSIQNFESGLMARVNIFRGGRDILRRRMAEKGFDISRLDLVTVKNELIASVIKAFYTALAARDFIGIAGDSYDTVAAQLKQVKVRFEGGSALKSEVLSLEVRLAQAKADAIKAKNAYSISLAALANLMGINADTQMALSKDELHPPEFPADYDMGILAALARRPELLRVREQIIASRMSLDMERAAYLPVIDAQARAYLDDEHFMYDVDRGNWTVGVMLNWEFFSGFATKARIEKARAVLQEMLAVDRKVTQSIQLDVKTAYLKREEAEARLRVAKAGVAQAEEALRLVRREYEGGSATIVRYLDAEFSHNSARVAETSAHFDLKKAEADVARALGYFGEHEG